MKEREDETISPRFRRASHVAWRRIGSETIVLDLKGKRAFGLNEPAGALWHALAELADGVGATAPNDPDAGAFLAQLVSFGLAEAVSDGVRSATVPLPGPGEGPPRITWSGDIPSFGQSCARVPGQSGICESHPQS